MAVERVQAVDSSEAAALVNISRTHQVGSHTSNLAVVRNNPHQGLKGGVNFGPNGEANQVGGGVARYQAANPLPDGMVELPNGMRTTVAAAKAIGYAVEDADGVFLTEQGQRDVQKAMSGDVAKNAAASKEAQLFAASDKILDNMEAELGPQRYTALANAVVADDPQALAAVPDTVRNAFERFTLNAVKDLGFSGLTALEYLPDDYAQEAREAIVNGNVQGIRLAGQRAIENVAYLPDDEDFCADVEEAGGSIVGKGASAVLVLPNRQSMSLIKALMSGVLRR